MQFKIRRMKTEDLETVSQLFELANPFTTAEHIKEWTIKNLETYPELCFVAVKGMKIIGAVSGRVEKEKIGIIEDIAVHPGCWKKGVGSTLLERQIQEFKSMGIEDVIAEVHYKCASALPFYYKHGFRMKKVVLDMFGPHEDGVAVRLKLK